MASIICHPASTVKTNDKTARACGAAVLRSNTRPGPIDPALCDSVPGSGAGVTGRAAPQLALRPRSEHGATHRSQGPPQLGRLKLAERFWLYPRYPNCTRSSLLGFRLLFFTRCDRLRYFCSLYVRCSSSDPLLFSVFLPRPSSE